MEPPSGDCSRGTDQPRDRSIQRPSSVFCHPGLLCVLSESSWQQWVWTGLYGCTQKGQWGVVDVEDVVAGVRYLTQSGRVDGSRCAVMGGSAGGYTVLQSMIQQPDIFCAGVSLYGVTDLFGLLADTHKFEAHYPDGLVGVLPQDRRNL